MPSEKQQEGLNRARKTLDRVKGILEEEKVDSYGMGEVVGRIKNGSLCVIRTDRLIALLDKYDALEASVVEEKTYSGKLLDTIESEGNLFEKGHPQPE